MENLYTYAVARVKAREDSLLSLQDIEQLVSAKSYESCIRTLADKGFDGDGSFSSYDELLAGEQQKLWDFISELTDDLSVFDVFRIEKDFHNLKAAIKAQFAGDFSQRIFVSGGTVDTEILGEAVKNRDFSVLPEFFRKPCEDAVSILNKTADGQRCDIVLDKAMVAAKMLCAKRTKNEFLIKYAEIFADISALKVAARCCQLKKSKEFVEFALCESGLKKDGLVEASVSGKESLLEFLRLSEFSDAAAELGKSYPAFEKWCDNCIMDFIKGQKSNYFTIAPVAAFILARENEMRTVRIILSAKANGFSDELVRERLRDMYV